MSMQWMNWVSVFFMLLHRHSCWMTVSLTDFLLPLSGKSALHWAAAVNNVEATIALLKNGANKDMQDLKV